MVGNTICLENLIGKFYRFENDRINPVYLLPLHVEVIRFITSLNRNVNVYLMPLSLFNVMMWH